MNSNNQHVYLRVLQMDNDLFSEFAKSDAFDKYKTLDPEKLKRLLDPGLNKNTSSSDRVHLRVAYRNYGMHDNLLIFYLSNNDDVGKVYSNHDVQIVKVYKAGHEITLDEFVSYVRVYIKHAIAKYKLEVSSALLAVDFIINQMDKSDDIEWLFQFNNPPLPYVSSLF